MIIKNIKFRNFMSYGDNLTEIDLLKKPTSLVVGPNGMGKSVPFTDVISYAFYNKPFRTINKPQLVNSISGKGLFVEVELDVGSKSFKIVRGIKPNIFEIWENGVLIEKPASDVDYQRYLERSVLKMSFKAFSQVVVLGKANYTAFMNLATADRRKIVEDLLDLDIFSAMNKLLKKQVEENNASIQDIGHTISLLETTITQKRKALATVQKQSESLVKDIDDKIAEISEANVQILSRLDGLAKTIDGVKATRKADEEICSKLLPYEEVHAGLKRKLSAFEKEISFYKNTNHCSACKQEIDAVFCENKIASLTGEMSLITDQFPLIDEKLTVLNQHRKSVKETTSTIAQFEKNRTEEAAQLRANKSYVEKLEQDKKLLLEPKEDNSIIEKELASLDMKLADVVARRSALLKQKDILEVSAVMLKDGGIKTKIIQQYIPMMNKILAKYLSVMDFDVIFELDENFNEVVRTRNMETFSYNSFSEGEKARIELALLFTWREITKLRASTNTNLLILDEVFDGSMDAQGGDDFLNILGRLPDNHNIFVITHKTDSYVEKFDRVLTVSKKRGYSYIKET